MTKDDALRMALKVLMNQEFEQDEDCGHLDCQECQYNRKLREAITAIKEALEEDSN